MNGSVEEIKAYIDKHSVPEPMTGCILWTAGSDKNGYGKIAVSGKDWRVHRLVFSLYKKHLDPGMLVCHKCDTPSCINPMHLFAGTPLNNMQDKVKKGRLKNQNMNKTHCSKGHEFTEDNIRYSLSAAGNKRRTCIICYTNGYKTRNALKKKVPK